MKWQRSSPSAGRSPSLGPCLLKELQATVRQTVESQLLPSTEAGSKVCQYHNALGVRTLGLPVGKMQMNMGKGQ